ncbi:DUF6457 domain-containing protein [Plantactinospora endophytica]|uniref:DUF6457 domain-containing protein n=1 Tax=Plantactinospora endophytica TaxID=673535 RepID=A0ABQ4E2S4_9ACTN|nr:DUF6457 domain-containing protein [Plantactinospora endophytica]GIG89000.1 hypothetical protein Pen02_39360 [Plantactinospora endophytica]
MNVMDRWLAAACAELRLDPAEVDVRQVLDLARDVAHNVLRPGAPVTAYLLGVAVGRGADPAVAAAGLAALADKWPTDQAEAESGAGRETGSGAGATSDAPTPGR